MFGKERSGDVWMICMSNVEYGLLLLGLFGLLGIIIGLEIQRCMYGKRLPKRAG